MVRVRRVEGRWVETRSFKDLEAVAEVLGKPLLRVEGGERPWLAVLDGAVIYAYHSRRGELLVTANMFDAMSAVHTSVLRCVEAGLRNHTAYLEPYSMGGLWLEDTWRMAEEILRREVNVNGRPVRVMIESEPERGMSGYRDREAFDIPYRGCRNREEVCGRLSPPHL